MYSAFDDAMNHWFYEEVDRLPQTRYTLNAFDTDEVEDHSWDRLLDPIARPRPASMPDRPPPIGHGEVTTSSRTARQKAYAQLMQHQLVGVPGARRGSLNAPMAEQSPGQNTGLALVNPTTGVVEYIVFAPNTRDVLWRRTIGTLEPGQRGTPQGREDGVRTLLTRVTGQGFQQHNARTAGPDLLPATQPAQRMSPQSPQTRPQRRSLQHRPTARQRSLQRRLQQHPAPEPRAPRPARPASARSQSTRRMQQSRPAQRSQRQQRPQRRHRFDAFDFYSDAFATFYE